MTNRQYYRLVQNRRRLEVHAAVDGRMETRFLRGAARDLRQRAAVQRVLERVLPVRWLRAAHVEIVKGGTVAIGVGDPMIREEMERDKARLQRELAQTVRGLRRVRIGLSAGPGQC